MTKSVLVSPGHLLAGVLALFAACGDNLDGVRDQPRPDAAGELPPRAVAVSGNFMAGQPGVMSALDLSAMTVAERVAPNGAIGNDPVIRKFDNELFVINRTDGNNVTILDATTFAVKEQLATGAGSNPQDVAIVGDKLYVPGFGMSGVVVLTRGSTTPATIDLSALDPDGKPNCISAYRVGTDIYVACELLDPNYVPRAVGKIVVIDSATDTVRTMFDLGQLNPFGMFEPLPASHGGGLVIPSYTFGDLTEGCVERITTGATPSSMGCLITNVALGGLAGRIEFQQLGSTPILWMVVSWFDGDPIGNLQGFDLESMTKWPEPITPASQLLVDMAPCPDGRIVVADQTMASHGLRVYEGGLEVTTAPLGIGLKPASSHGLLCY
ncbi:MAG: hypothetical protein WKG01_31635 [Kofleriaceae bacterium]